MEDKLTVLVIEDDPDIQAVIEDALTDGGFDPAIAPSGEEAVSLLQSGLTNYRALVTDINLRGRMDGWHIARKAREADPEFPVVYITAAHGDQWASQGVPSQQHSFKQAIRSRSACHSDCPASECRQLAYCMTRAEGDVAWIFLKLKRSERLKANRISAAPPVANR